MATANKSLQHDPVVKKEQPKTRSAATIDLESERDFHNKRFAEGDSRSNQKKYYWAIGPFARKFEAKIAALSQKADVLEYGCANGDQVTRLSGCKSYAGIDISDVAVENARQANTAPNFSFHVMDAMNTDFPDNSFDLVIGVGIIHHLDVPKAAQEINRLLRPGGRAIFWEPLGLNPIINLYRLLTPSARTIDERPLWLKDIRTLRKTFSTVSVECAGITSLAAVPLRETSIGDATRNALTTLDRVVSIIPGVKYLSWFSVINVQKGGTAAG